MPRTVGRRGKGYGLAACLAGLLVTACYAPRPLDGRVLLTQMRQADSAGQAAERKEAGGGLLTEEDGVREALARAPAVQDARAAVAEAEGGVDRTRAVDNPEVRADNAYLNKGKTHTETDVYRLGVDLRVNLPSQADRQARIDTARAEVAAARAAVLLAEARVRRDVRVSFARATAARAAMVLLERLVAARHEREASLAVALAGGQGMATDLAQARLATADAEDRLGRAVEEQADALGSLGRVLGVEPPVPGTLALPEQPACRQPPEGGAGLEDRVLATSPTLENRRALHLRAEKEAQAEHLAWLPRLKYVEVGYTRNFLVGAESTVPGYQFEPRYYAWSVHLSLALELPLWNFNQGKIRTAEARVERETARFREALSGTVADLQQQLARWRTARDRAGRTEAVAVPAAEEAMRATRQGLESGRLSVASALEAEERLLLARVRLVEDQAACRIAEVEVEAVLGGPGASP